MPTCFALNCNETSDAISFHKIPTNPEKRKIWLNALGIEESVDHRLIKNIRICHHHFDESDFIPNVNQRHILKDEVFPKIQIKFCSQSEFYEYVSERKSKSRLELNKTKICSPTTSPIQVKKADKFICDNIIIPSITVATKPKLELDEDKPLIEWLIEGVSKGTILKVDNDTDIESQYNNDQSKAAKRTLEIMDTISNVISNNMASNNFSRYSETSSSIITKNGKKISNHNNANTSIISSNSQINHKSLITTPSSKKISTKKSTHSIDLSDIPKGDKCILCDEDIADENGFGQIVKHRNITIHYFCLLFSAGLDQKEDQNDELFGFNFDAVIKEYRRGLKLKCYHCKRFGATIGCNIKVCRKTYHFPCSLSIQALNLYYGSFSSYCPEHRSTFCPPSTLKALSPVAPSTPSDSPCPEHHDNENNKKRRRRFVSRLVGFKKSKISRSKTAVKSPSTTNLTATSYDEGIEIQRLECKSNVLCLICRDEFENHDFHEFHVLRSECCEKAFFHRYCIQKQAFHSGYLFQCPNCCDKDKFRKSMLNMGIYIPERDASWELEKNAFEELYQKPSSCTSQYCLCPYGVTSFKDMTIWEKVSCQGCGHVVCHLACVGLKITHNRTWYCLDCSPIYLVNQTENISCGNNKPRSNSCKPKKSSGNRKRSRRPVSSRATNFNKKKTKSKPVFNFKNCLKKEESGKTTELISTEYFSGSNSLDTTPAIEIKCESSEFQELSVEQVPTCSNYSSSSSSSRNSNSSSTSYSNKDGNIKQEISSTLDVPFIEMDIKNPQPCGI